MHGHRAAGREAVLPDGPADPPGQPARRRVQLRVRQGTVLEDQRGRARGTTGLALDVRVQRGVEVVGACGVVPGVELLQFLVRQHPGGRDRVVGAGQQGVQQSEVVAGGAVPLGGVEADGVEVEVEHEARRGGGVRAQLTDLEGEPVGGVPGVEQVEADRAAEPFEDRVLVVEVDVVEAGAAAVPGHMVLVAGRLEEGPLGLPGEEPERGVAGDPQLQRQHVHEQAGRVPELGRAVGERRADAEQFTATDPVQVGEEGRGEGDGGRGVALLPGELGDAGAASGVQLDGDPCRAGRPRHVVFPAVEGQSLHRLGQRLAPVPLGPLPAPGAAQRPLVVDVRLERRQRRGLRQAPLPVEVVIRERGSAGTGTSTTRRTPGGPRRGTRRTPNRSA